MVSEDLFRGEKIQDIIGNEAVAATVLEGD